MDRFVIVNTPPIGLSATGKIQIKQCDWTRLRQPCRPEAIPPFEAGVAMVPRGQQADIVRHQQSVQVHAQPITSARSLAFLAPWRKSFAANLLLVNLFTLFIQLRSDLVIDKYWGAV